MLEFIKNNIGLSIVLLCLFLGLVAFIAWILWSNKAIKLSEVSIKAPLDLKIIQISDYHNAYFKNNLEKPLALIRDAEPDIIVITGDFIDSRHTNLKRSIAFATELVKIAPCYYTPGNHESRMPREYTALVDTLEELGVCVLCDSSITLDAHGVPYTLIGVEDPMFEIKKNDSVEKVKVVVRNKLQELIKNDDTYKIVLCHRPEAFSIYVQAGVDLAFTGHAHGGQVQIPFVGGLIAPNQGFFPKYTQGTHTSGKTTMIISRGIGNSLCPIRVNNRPEIILANLNK